MELENPNGDMNADRNCSRLQIWVDHQSGFIFPGVFVPGVRQNCFVEVRFLGNQSKH